MSRLAALLAASLLSFGIFAAPVEIKGARNCGKWIEERRAANSSKDLNKIPVLITRSWFLGYLSGRAAQSGKDFLKSTDSDSIFLWLDNYCRDHAQAELDQAAIDLARELMQMKGIKP
jgi:hypothetical protein